MAHAYPLMLDVSDRLAVVVGGGTVAARKVRGLLEAGARRVRVVSPAFGDDFPSGPAVERVAEGYAELHLAGAGLVFAATDDPAVNRAVVADARRLNLLASRADGDENAAGDFSTPAVLRDGPITVTVSAGGSPAVAAALRDALKPHVEPRWRAMAEAMRAIRPAVRAAGLPVARRREIFRALASAEAMTVVTNAGPEGLRQWLRGRWPELGR